MLDTEPRFRSANLALLATGAEHHTVAIVARDDIVPRTLLDTGFDHFAIAFPAAGDVVRSYQRLKALGTAAGLAKNVTAYGLRHSFGTRMAAAGVPLLDLAKIMGTSVQMIERHYGHYDPARGASHMDRVFGLEDSTEVQSADA